MQLAEDEQADLLVVGNVGLSTIAGRLLGSVPANVSRRAKVDVLIVHTTQSSANSGPAFCHLTTRPCAHAIHRQRTVSASRHLEWAPSTVSSPWPG